MTQFKVGDRVVATSSDICGLNLKGKVGTIVETILLKSGIVYGLGVEFDNHIYGHSCNHSAKEGYGWYGASRDFSLIHEKEIIDD